MVDIRTLYLFRVRRKCGTFQKRLTVSSQSASCARSVCLAFSVLYHRFSILSRTFFESVETDTFDGIGPCPTESQYTALCRRRPSGSVRFTTLYHRCLNLSSTFFDFVESHSFHMLMTFLRLSFPFALARSVFCIPLSVFPSCCCCRWS